MVYDSDNYQCVEKHFLSTGPSEAAAQWNGKHINCKGDLVRNIYTERADRFTSIISIFENFSNPFRMACLQRVIEIVRSFRSVFLGKMG